MGMVGLESKVEEAGQQRGATQSLIVSTLEADA